MKTISQLMPGKNEATINLPIEVAYKVIHVRNLINSHKNLSDRKTAIIKAGYRIKEVHMGSGGVGQVKIMTRDNSIRVQIESGHGSDNYADSVIL